MQQKPRTERVVLSSQTLHKQETVTLVSDVFLVGAKSSEQMPDTVYHEKVTCSNT